jgi:formylglycine-generating enzyme required for sulfatase activity
VYVTGSSEVPEFLDFVRRTGRSFLRKPFQHAELGRLVGLTAGPASPPAKPRRLWSRTSLGCFVVTTRGHNHVVPSEWTPPTEFDDYNVLQRLGAGSNGSVWLAEDMVLARHVAVKFPAGQALATADRQRFLVEARAAARLQHPNVVSIYRVGEVDDRPYLVCEFVRGKTLDTIGKPLPTRDALRIATDLARGLAAAHRAGVLHRDIKPANAIVAEDGAGKLLDFGLAAFSHGDGADTATTRGAIDGTPAYLAPEVWRGQPHTRRTDVYAFGAMIYELRAGLPPFAGVAVADLARATGERDAASLAIGDDPLDARLAAIVSRCLDRDPAIRFASGDELRAALEELVRGGDRPQVIRGNPYRGLRAFQADHRALFFGRASEIGIAVERLRSDACLLVTGDSGVGKSSLCRAGVIPEFMAGSARDGRQWTSVTMVPGRRPLRALCSAVADLAGIEPTALEDAVERDPPILARALHHRGGTAGGVLLFIDQLEELATIADPRQALVVDSALAEITAGVPGVRLLATVRADFLGRLARLPRIAEDFSRVLYFLRPLSRERIRDVIAGPARIAGTRFETEALVETLVEATTATDGALPLLQFTLAELWERRDVASETITEALLSEVGGVAGALARHADTVIAALSPLQRTRARRMLLRLVTLDGTRARRSDAELGTGDADARAALDALVRGRLVVAYEGEEGSAYEIAHEALVGGWSTLGRWLLEEKDRRAVREALATAAAEWSRSSRSSEALLGAGRLSEVEGLAFEDLTTVEEELVAASRRALRRRRVLRWATIAAVPVLALATWATASSAARTDARRKFEVVRAAGVKALAASRARDDEVRTARARAFALSDARDPTAEAAWDAATALASAVDRDYRDAATSLEAALTLDPGQRTVRNELADALYERAVLSEEWHHADRAEELVRRMLLYDDRGERRRRWEEPATLLVRTDPPSAEVRLSPAPPAPAAEPEQVAGAAARSLYPGTWVLDVSARGRADVRVVFLARRGERLELDVALPVREAVPPGFVYLPAGAFEVGSAADDAVRRGFFNAPPLHTVRTAAFFIARAEVTYGDWLGWLEALPPAERARRTPSVAAGLATPGAVSLRRNSAGWELLLHTGASPVVGRTGEPLVYPQRGRNARVDWLRLPVTGVSPQDFEAFAAWLDATGRVPGARLCSELEWERAARGADGRPYPHGFALEADDANHDATYGRDAMGPDPVGSHPRSRSLYGIDDASGNAFEITRGVDPGVYVARGGSYWHDRKTADLANREVMVPTMRDATIGARICASPRG